MAQPYDFAVYIDPSTLGKKVPWLKVGVGFWHKDGEGISLKLQAFPIGSGHLILRSWDDEQMKKEKFQSKAQTSEEDREF